MANQTLNNQTDFFLSHIFSFWYNKRDKYVLQIWIGGTVPQHMIVLLMLCGFTLGYLASSIVPRHLKADWGFQIAGNVWLSVHMRVGCQILGRHQPGHASSHKSLLISDVGLTGWMYGCWGYLITLLRLGDSPLYPRTLNWLQTEAVLDMELYASMSVHFREYEEDAVSQAKQDFWSSSLDGCTPVSFLFLSSSLIDTKMWWNYWKKQEPIFPVTIWKVLEPSFAGDTDILTPHSSLV